MEVACLEGFRVMRCTLVPLFVPAPVSRESQELGMGCSAFRGLAPGRQVYGLMIVQPPFSKHSVCILSQYELYRDSTLLQSPF